MFVGGGVLHFHHHFPVKLLSVGGGGGLHCYNHFSELKFLCWGGGCTFIRLLLGCALMWVRNTTCQIRLQTSDFIHIADGDSGRAARYGGYAMSCRGILLAVCAVQSERGDPVLTCRGGGWTHDRVHDRDQPCPNIPPGDSALGPCVRPRRVGPGILVWGGGGGALPASLLWSCRTARRSSAPSGCLRACRPVPLSICALTVPFALRPGSWARLRTYPGSLAAL